MTTSETGIHTLYIGGQLAQVGEKLNDLTLLDNQNMLRSAGYYHSWIVNGTELVEKDTDPDSNRIFNNSRKNLVEYSYFDGIQENKLMISGGLVKVKRIVSLEIFKANKIKTEIEPYFGNSGGILTTSDGLEKKRLDEKYGKGLYTKFILPYLKGIIEWV